MPELLIHTGSPGMNRILLQGDPGITPVATRWVECTVFSRQNQFFLKNRLVNWCYRLIAYPANWFRFAGVKDKWDQFHELLQTIGKNAASLMVPMGSFVLTKFDADTFSTPACSSSPECGQRGCSLVKVRVLRVATAE